jgi:membrane-associated protease RseP (regulator of RpoE activity)
MKPSMSVGRVGTCLVLSWAAIASAQAIAPIPGPPPAVAPYRLGLIDSRTAEIEVIPGVRLRGLEVLGVVPGSPAGRAGLGAGDVILSANSARIVAPDDLRRALAESGGRLRLKVFEARTEQVLNVAVVLGPPSPGAGPTPITVVGRIKFGGVAVGAETTGITLTAADGMSYDLDFGAARPPDRAADGRAAVVSGVLTVGPGPERPSRRVLKVSDFRIVGVGPPRPD